MKTSKQLKEERAAIAKEALDIIDLAKKEDRDLTPDEEIKVNGATEKTTGFDELIANAENREKLEGLRSAPIVNTGVSANEPKEVKSYSLVKAIRSQLPNQQLEGLELEMHQEAVKEVQERGGKIEGVGVPSFITEKRDLNVGTAVDGGNTVPTEHMGFIEALQPKLQVEGLGATIMRGLTGNVDIPRNSTKGAAVWEGETDANAEAAPKFDKISLTPNRLGAKTIMSKQLLFQSSIDVERFAANDLGRAIAIAVDAAAINGAGSGSVPEGILNVTGIGDVAGGTNGLAPTFANLISLESELAVDNADVGSLAYLTTPGIRGYLKGLKKDAGSGEFVFANNELNGYRAAISTQVPSTLTKGTSSGTCHAIIFGDFSQLILAQWSGMDLVVDPYTLATNGQVQIVANTWWDVAVRHAEAFAAMQDALTS